MKSLPVIVPAIKELIVKSPGFAKKHLSDRKLDIMALCGYGCRYCSSNSGNYLRSRRAEFADITETQIGRRAFPSQEPALTFLWADVLERLERQLATKAPTWGNGETLVFSMLTDGFSPILVGNGTTRKALEMVLSRTAFRIRVLTKNAVVGQPAWTEFFAAHSGRFVVGLSMGSTDSAWAHAVEVGTSSPVARQRAYLNLRTAGVPTYGMLCPVFPDALLAEGALDALIDAVRPDVAEHVWAEPYNDRENWRAVRAGYPEGSRGYDWFTNVYEKGDRAAWSAYATDLYVRLRERARREGWLHKLKYLLYEDGIVEKDAHEYRGMEGVLLQSKPAPDGRSANPHIAAVQS